MKKIAALVLALSTLVLAANASADSMESALDAEIGLPTTVAPAIVETSPAPRRDPATAGTVLPGSSMVEPPIAGGRKHGCTVIVTEGRATFVNVPRRGRRHHHDSADARPSR